MELQVLRHALEGRSNLAYQLICRELRALLMAEYRGQQSASPASSLPAEDESPPEEVTAFSQVAPQDSFQLMRGPWFASW